MPQYERAVIFRLGRIKDGREKGPGIYLHTHTRKNQKVWPGFKAILQVILRTSPKKVFVIMLSNFYPGLFFILPCIDKFTSVDVRIKSFDVPPQKVRQYCVYGVPPQKVRQYCVYGVHEMAVLCYTTSPP